MPDILTPGGAGAATATPSVVVTFPGTYPNPLVMNTQGDLDWIILTNAATVPSSSMTQPRKKQGGWIASSFMWTPAGHSQFNSTGGSTTTATAADNITGTAYSSNPIIGYQNLAGGFGMGFTFRVPAITTTRYVRIWTGWGGGNWRLTGTLTDGTTHNLTQAPAGGMWQIAYNASSNNQELVVNAEMTSGSGTVTMWVQAIALASV